MSSPWAKFYYSDWRSDPRLRLCSLAARGLWIEMLALMHEAEPHGHLVVNGRAPTDAQLAVLTGASTEPIPDLLGELESAGVFSRTQKGVIYSRRMTRDMKKAQLARKNGKSGGNPRLSKQRRNPPSDNPEVKPQVNPWDNTQKPEARSQNTAVVARVPEPWIELGYAVMDIMGVRSDPNWFGNASPAKVWIDWGAIPDVDVFPVVHKLLASHLKKGRGPPRTLNYFDEAIADSIAQRTTRPRPEASDGNGSRTSTKSAKTTLDDKFAAIDRLGSHPVGAVEPWPDPAGGIVIDQPSRSH